MEVIFQFLQHHTEWEEEEEAWTRLALKTDKQLSQTTDTDTPSHSRATTTTALAACNTLPHPPTMPGRIRSTETLLKIGHSLTKKYLDQYLDKGSQAEKDLFFHTIANFDTPAYMQGKTETKDWISSTSGGGEALYLKFKTEKQEGSVRVALSLFLSQKTDCMLLLFECLVDRLSLL